jgi:hypothetical protein
MNPGMNAYGSIPVVMRFAMLLGELSAHCMQRGPIQEKEEKQKTRKNISLRNGVFQHRMLTYRNDFNYCQIILVNCQIIGVSNA